MSPMFGHHDAAPDTPGLPPGAYLMRHKMTSIEGFLVFDGGGNQLYHFKGHLAFGKQKWSMLDASGAEVAQMERGAMHIHPNFTLRRPGRTDVTVRKANFMPVNETWRIEGAEDGDIDINGDIVDHEFTMVDGSGATVATVSRAWVSIRDAYGLQVGAMDPVLAIAAVVGIDDAENITR